MFVLLKKQGLPLFRVHTDRGREFINNELRSYLLARDVYHTSTPADLPSANGLVERYIGILKSQARTALCQSELGEKHWPSAMRHVSARKFASSMAQLGTTPKRFLPFGSKIVVQARSWKQKTWLPRGPRGLDARLLRPSPEVSKGWVFLVANADGSSSFVITTLRYSKIREPQPTEIEQSAPELATELPPSKPKADGNIADLPVASSSDTFPPSGSRRRLTGKQPLRETQGGVHSLSSAHSVVQDSQVWGSRLHA